MSVEDPIFKGYKEYGTDTRAKGDFGQDVYQNGSKPGPNVTKVNMNETHGKPGKKS